MLTRQRTHPPFTSTTAKPATAQRGGLLSSTRVPPRTDQSQQLLLSSLSHHGGRSDALSSLMNSLLLLLPSTLTDASSWFYSCTLIIKLNEFIILVDSATLFYSCTLSSICDATARRFHQLPTSALRIGSDFVNPSTSVRDLGIYFDADLRMRCHVQKTAVSCFAVLRQLRRSDVQFRRLCTRRSLSPSSCHGSTTAMLCWWAYQATCTAAYNRYSTLPRDPSLTCGARTTSPTHSPVSTG